MYMQDTSFFFARTNLSLNGAWRPPEISITYHIERFWTRLGDISTPLLLPFVSPHFCSILSFFKYFVWSCCFSIGLSLGSYQSSMCLSRTEGPHQANSGHRTSGRSDHHRRRSVSSRQLKNLPRQCPPRAACHLPLNNINTNTLLAHLRHLCHINTPLFCM